MGHKEEDQLIEKAVIWGAKASLAIREAGGEPVGVLSRLPQDALTIFVRNNLDITFQKRPESNSSVITLTRYEFDDEE